MEYIYIGKIVNTHGIKGEVRIKSDFQFKSEIFKINTKLYIGKEKKEEIINTYRIHKDYDMVTFTGIDNINDVLKYKNDLIYANKSSLKIDGYLDEELIGMDVYMNDFIGKVTDIKLGTKYNFIVIGNKLIPNIKEFIKNVDLENKRIDLYSWEGLVDEN